MRIAVKGRWQFGQHFRRSILKASVPKWSGKLRPDPHQTEVVGDNLRPLPKLFTQGVSLFGMSIGLAAESALGSVNLQSRDSKQFPAFAFDHLELLKAFLQILPGEAFL